MYLGVIFLWSRSILWVPVNIVGRFTGNPSTLKKKYVTLRFSRGTSKGRKLGELACLVSQGKHGVNGGLGWCGGKTVWRRFDPWPGCGCVMTLGKLFTPRCFCHQWSLLLCGFTKPITRAFQFGLKKVSVWFDSRYWIDFFDLIRQSDKFAACTLLFK